MPLLTQSELLTAFADNSSGAITASDVRDFINAVEVDALQAHLPSGEPVQGNPHGTTLAQVLAIPGAISITLNSSYGNAVIGTDALPFRSRYWVSVDDPYNIYLPPVASMTDKSIEFICTQQIDEQWVQIIVNSGDTCTIQNNGSSYGLDGYSTVEFTSDGANWWITDGYNEGAN